MAVEFIPSIPLAPLFVNTSICFWLEVAKKSVSRIGSEFEIIKLDLSGIVSINSLITRPSKGK